MDQLLERLTNQLSPLTSGPRCCMGLGIDTVVASAVNPGAAPAADNAVVNAGDSKTVRNFATTSRARLDFAARQGAAAGFISIKSPRFHDVSRGLQWQLSETPTSRLLPPETGQPVYGADILQLTLSGGGAETDGMAFGVYYYDLPGVSAILKSPADIMPNIANIKPAQVGIAAPGTAFAWVDAAFTTTENLYKANIYYAVLGYETDTAALAIGVKGPETGNLRVCGPGAVSGLLLSDYFVWMSDRHNAPYIPIFAANDRANFFACASQVAVAGTLNVTFNLAEMAAGWTP